MIHSRPEPADPGNAPANPPAEPSADPLELAELRALARERRRRRKRDVRSAWRQSAAPDIAWILATLAWIVPWILLAFGRGAPSSGLILVGGWGVVAAVAFVAMVLAAATLAAVVFCAVRRRQPAWKWILAGLAILPHGMALLWLRFGL